MQLLSDEAAPPKPLKGRGGMLVDLQKISRQRLNQLPNATEISGLTCRYFRFLLSSVNFRLVYFCATCHQPKSPITKTRIFCWGRPSTGSTRSWAPNMTYSLMAREFVDLTAVIESHRQYERDVHFRISGCRNSKGLPTPFSQEISIAWTGAL